MQDYVKPYIEKIEGFAVKKDAYIELLVIGGLAMSFYKIPRYTIDIDAEIKCNDNVYPEFIKYLKDEGIVSNISENISGWGIVPMPEGYRERAGTVYKSDYLLLKVLEPVDFVLSKLLRGTEEDFNDSMSVIQQYSIAKDSLVKRIEHIRFPKDPETFFFKKKIQHLFNVCNF